MGSPPDHITALRANQMRATSGVNRGDPMGPAESLVLGDGYTLEDGAQEQQLATGDLTLLARLVFMTTMGDSVETVLLSKGQTQWLHLIDPIDPGTEYILIAQEAPPQELVSPDISGLSFGRGTRITLSDGSQCEVERVEIGQRLLTRDAGMQEVREVRRRTLRAAGQFAPVVIAQGAMGNAETLAVGQTHHMLLSNWRAEVLCGARDVLIAARDLVNDDTIFLRRGGFIEYITLLFDIPQIIYAEGVPCESGGLSASPRTRLDHQTAAELLHQMGRV